MFLFALFFFLLGYLISSYPGADRLFNSVRTPWGFLTSIFIYDGSGNVEYFLIFAILFSAANISHARELRIKRTAVALLASVLGSIIANLLDLALFFFTDPAASSYGQSGVVYGLMGSAASMALLDIIFYILVAMGQLRHNDSSPDQGPVGHARNILSIASLALIFLLTFVFMALDIKAFYSIRPGIDSFVHAMAFGSSAIIFIIISYTHASDLLWVSDQDESL
ncbi:hypothetical membrane protein [Thermoplasma acidophilum]|uniref:Hypothetical membrane protein n=1 Tax=Thermoplasma acidophilum (strain ATCC 25905 / DSM 1728 / JCM 9062 / NBRC 15155 / AMRC-C165) TaxID=273075 RepID=Q9HK75_THEAC|nr:hypothetical membrane protein [Thermoplasma acidophilum]